MESHPRLLVLTFALILVGLISAFIEFERASGFDAILTENAFEDLRWRLWPILSQMVSAHWLFGIGFGSFEEVYHMYEPTELLLASYLNQAHNDWVQFAIEGGVPALLLLAILLGWFILSLRALLVQSEIPIVRFIFWSSTVGIICAASAIDYALRAPVLQLVGVWLFLTLQQERYEYAGER